MQHDPESTLPEAEKFSDPYDRASDIEQRANAHAVYQVQQRSAPQQQPRADGSYAVTDCDGCGDEIGEKRLQVAIRNRLCIYCATAEEKRR